MNSSPGVTASPRTQSLRTARHTLTRSASAPMRLRFRVSLLAVLLTVSLGALSPAAASAADCSSGSGSSTAWTGAGGDGQFTNAQNWSNGVPSGACTASIAGASVVLEGGASFTALNLTGGASLSITGFTDVNGNAQTSSLSTNATLVASGAAIHLTSTSADLSNGNHPINPGAAILAGTVTNSGVITTDVGQTGANTYRDIRANVTNNAGATITMHTDMSTCGCGSGGTWVNNGTMTTDAGTTSTFTRTGAGIVFSQPQSTGTFADNGHAVITGTFTNTGGTTTGHPIEIGGDLSAPSPAPASFEFDTIPSVTGGGSLTGDIGAQTTVLIHNNTAANSSINVTVATDVTNHGTLRLDGGPGQDQLIGSGGHTLTNAGTLSLSADSSAPSMHITTAVVNTGTIDLGANTNADINAGFGQSAGTFTIHAGATFSSANTVTLSGGTIANSGTLNAINFTDTGGTETGSRVELCGGTLTAPGAGAARFEIVDNAGCNGGGIANGSTVGANIDVVLRSFAAQNDVGSGSFTNDGTVSVVSDATHQVQLHGTTLTNNGTLNIIGSNIDIALSNHGTTNITAAPGVTTGFASPITQAAGSLNIGSGATLNLGDLTVSGGTIANQGVMMASGSLVASGGQVNGDPPTFAGANVTLSGSGSGTFDLSSANLLSYRVPAGYHLISDGSFQLSSGQPTINSGTIELRGGSGSNPHVFSGTLDNQGTLSTTAAQGSSRSIDSAFQNEGTMDLGADLGLSHAFSSSGSIDISGGATLSTAGFTQTAGITRVTSHADTLTSSSPISITGGTLQGAGIVNANLVNQGTVAPTPASPTLTINGTYAQAAAGFLATDVESSGTGTLNVTGAATLNGTLQVSTGSTFAPAKGQAFTSVNAASVGGSFATTAGLDSGPYSLAYSATAATLTALGRTSPPAPAPGSPPATPSLSIGDATVADPQTGTTTATFTLTLSAPSAVPITVDYATANGTAIAPDEYQASSGTLTIGPGQTTTTVPVTVYGDGRPGASRTFFLDLQRPRGATLSNARGTGTILGKLVATEVAPANGGDAGSTSLTITGSGLSSADQVTLTAAGKPVIAATTVSAASDGRSLSATVPLAGAPIGARDVHVSSGTGLGTQTLAAAFTVQRATPPAVVAQVGGPRTTRLDGGWYGHVYLQNLGNTDAVNTLVRVDGLPTGVTATVDGAQGAPTQSDDGQEHSVTFLVPRVGGGSSVAMPLYFVFTDLKVAHKVVASLRARVLLESNPELDTTVHTTVLQAGTGSDGHFRATLQLQGRAGTGQISYDLYSAPPPPGAELPLVKFQPGANADTYTIVASVPKSGCSVPGDAQALVLHWDCQPADQGPGSFSGTTSLPANPLHNSSGHARAAGGTPSRRTSSSSVPQARPSNVDVDTVWEVFHVGHSLRELKSATAASAEDKERDIVIGCLHTAGFLGDSDTNLMEIAAKRDGGFDWTSLGTGLAQKGPVAGLTNIAAFTIIGAAFENKFDGELARRLLDAARFDQASNLRNPFRDLATQIGTRQLTPEEVRQVLKQAENECEKSLIHVEGRVPGGYQNWRNSDWRIPVSAVLSGDPNDMTGPPGPGGVHYLNGARKPYGYTVNFQNVPTATAPAYAVTVTDKLDATRLDPATATLGPVTFGTHTITPPPGVQHFSSEVDLRPASNQLVEVSGRVNPLSGVITWTFVTVDPTTHQVVLTPTGGFLPPDKSTPEGEGSATFSAYPTTGGRRARARTDNAASIVFDTNAPIATPVWTNIVDRTRPTSHILGVTHVTARVRRRRVHELVVRYAGRDGGSGVAGYTVYVAKGAGRLKAMAIQTPSQRVRLTCKSGARYRFAVAAQDRVGNTQRRRATSKVVRCR